jgi:hypothetical protein
MISDQDTTRKAIIKYKMREREIRREDNWEKVMAQKERSMQERSKVNQIRTSMSIRVKHDNVQELGEITEISEKLRDLCLQRGVMPQL